MVGQEYPVNNVAYHGVVLAAELFRKWCGDDCAILTWGCDDISVLQQNLDFFYTIIQKKELTIVGSRNALKKDFLELIDIVNAGKAPLEKIITNTYRFHDAAKAFEDFAHNPGDMLKVVIDFSDINE